MWKPIILDVECIVCNKSLQKINHHPLDATRKMGKITCRRSRTPNWSQEEKKYLLQLIKQRKDAVLTKNNNGPNYCEEKDVAWNEILRELSIKFGNKFCDISIKKVKTQWQNMKRIAREEISLVGSNIDKLTIQTLEVCNILDMIKNGVLKRDNENLNETVVTTNIEIKAERLDEDMHEPSGNGEHNISMQEPQEIEVLETNQPVVVQPSSSASSSPEHVSDVNEFETREGSFLASGEPSRKNVCAMTEDLMDTGILLNPLHRQLQDFFRYTSDEKQLKMESLKEERRVVGAMRETAELNKIIAEQKLKHVLWIQKQEMA